MIGNILLYLLFILSIIISALNLLSYGKSESKLLLSRRLFYGLLSGIILVGSFFLINIFAHNYQYTYIWENSSNQLTSYLLFASSFAGQQGSFMLWLVLFAIVGFFLLPYSKKSEYESLIMGFFVLILSFILLMLIFKSPFELIWDTFRNEGIAEGFTPTNGKGLNPILENIWITIHPPILFAGYALASVPFIYSLAGLIHKDKNKWLEYSFPWVLISSAVLGTGIVLGGFWAYETLGWGGFWGWDPVENSSLLPWISIMVLVHTMIIQRKTGRLVKTNYVLSIVSFILVLYATFLTRSGILGNTSVHSFTNPGNAVYILLLLMLIGFFLVGTILFIVRKKYISPIKEPMITKSREYFLSLGSIFLLLSGGIILLGTSWPLISEFLGMKRISASQSFYNDWNLPLIILILISNSITLFFSWQSGRETKFFKRSLIAFVLTIITGIVVIIGGVRDIRYIILLISAFYSLYVNIEFALRTLRKNPLGLGGYLSHTGISLLMIGVVGTGVYSSTHHLQIKKGETKTLGSIEFTFADKVQIQKEMPDRQKFIYRMKLNRNHDFSYIDPVVYWSDFNERKSPIIEPGIKSYLLEDVYVILKSADVDNPPITLSLQKGNSEQCPLDTSVKVEMVAFDMAHTAMTNPHNASMGVIVNYISGGVSVTDTPRTNMNASSVYKDVHWNKIPGSNTDIAFLRVIPSHEDIGLSQAVFAFKPSNEVFREPGELLTLEVSFKPFINFVWFGAGFIIVGFIFAILKNRF